jgi:eukaryotic-like serine/threonine-protein kinase
VSDPEDEILERLAESVADGSPVDWDAESSADESIRRRLTRLRILQSIGSASGMPQDAGAMPGPAVGGIEGAREGERWGHLEIREKVGEGVFGDVFRAWETTLEREVAVKFLRLGSSATPFAAHVLQEGRTMARVRHPNVITVYGAEELEGRVGFWMEYIRGDTLEDILEKQGMLGAREAAMIGVDLCRALAAVHQAGLVHRDVKTRNVMREEGGRIVLMDFGTGVETQPGGQIRAFASAGTPVYQAPEILRGEPASPRSDLFSLGVLLYRLVTRSYPVEAASFDELREAYALGKLRLLRDARPDLPAAFSQTVERAIALDPGDRFETAGDMERALEVTLDAHRNASSRTDAGIDVMAAGAETPPARTSRRIPRGRLAVLLAVALFLGVGTVAVVTHRSPVGGRHPETDRIPVAVADCVNETSERELDGLAGMLTTSLEQSRQLAVLTRSRMSDIMAQLGNDRSNRIDENLGREICRQARVRELFLPTIRKFGELYTIDLVVLDAERNEYVFTTREQTRNREHIPLMIDALSAKARAELTGQPPGGTPAAASIAQITTTDLDAYGHYYAGERLIDELEMQAARNEFEKAIAADSTFGLAYARLAYADWWLSDFDSQARHLKRARTFMDRIPEKEQFQVRAQSAMADKEGLEAARAILFEMEKLYPDDKEMLYDIGDLSSHLSEYKIAVEYLQRVASIDPRFERAVQHLARTYRDLGRAPEALEWSRRYAAVDQSWETADLLGSATIASGDFDAGLRVLVDARAAYPEYVPLTKSIASAYLVRGEFSQADAAWTSFFEGTHSSGEVREAFEVLGFEHAYQGRYRQALEDLDQAVAHTNYDAGEIYAAVARADRALLWTLGWSDSTAARREIDACSGVEESITYADAYFQYWPYWGRLFQLYLASGDVQQARELAERKLGMETWFRPYVQVYLECAMGECEQAAASATEILQWGPATENLELLYALSSCCAAQGRLAQAEEILLRLHSLDSNLTAGSPYVAKGLLLLGKVHEGRSEVALARQDYESFLQLWDHADRDLPDLVEAKERLAQLGATRGGR